MSKYREAFKRIRSIQVFNEDIMLRFENNIYEGYEDIKLLQELVDKHEEFESRKDKLVVGSEWVCVVSCVLEHGYEGGIEVLKRDIVHIKKIDRNKISIVHGFHRLTDNTEHFLLCFAPKEK